MAYLVRRCDRRPPPTSARTPPSAPTSGCSAGSSATSSAIRPATRCSTSSKPCVGAPSTPGATDAVRSTRWPTTLPQRPIDQQLHLIRAFGWLSLLANTAEDVHHERRRRFHRQHGSRPQLGSLAAAFDHLERAGLDRDAVDRLIDDLVVTPVITAHPTEVRRQTVLDVLTEVARLARRPHRPRRRRSRPRRHDRRLELAVLTLWQTAEVRLSKLRVVDEINEALRYYPASLFDVVAAIERTVEQLADERWGIDDRRQPGDPHGLVDRRRP